MTQLQGEFYDGRSSRKQVATLLLLEHGRLKLVHGEGEQNADLAAVQISDRLGQIPRRVVFAGGECFVTSDNQAIDRWLVAVTGKRSHTLIHRLESGAHYVAGALMLLVAAMAFFISVGVPRLAEEAAKVAPPTLLEHISVAAMERFDSGILQPSEVSSELQGRLQQRFAEMSATTGGSYRFKLHFRKAERLGPNAFALPSGDVVVTDELIQLADHGEEVLAVLAHEIGHVVKRHGVRRLFEESLLAVVVFGITGDTSSFAQSAAALPVLLVSSGYSRDFEREADRYALQLMQQEGIAKHYFADILTRIEEVQDNGMSVPGFLSSHPVTDERIQQFIE